MIIKHIYRARYGSRKGFAATIGYRLLYIVGGFRHYRHRIDWRSVERVVFVCKGNICRSAFAEAVGRKLGIDSGSCGIDTVDGAGAHIEAIRIADDRGIDLSAHKTTQITNFRFRKNDLLIAMEPWQVKFLEKTFDSNYCTLLGLWGTPVTPYIHDPYGLDPAYFEKCFDYIEDSVYGISKKLKRPKG